MHNLKEIRKDFDNFKKVLKKRFSNVTYVRNITDVDDKIIKSANEKNISISDLTESVINSFNKDVNEDKIKLVITDNAAA